MSCQDPRDCKDNVQIQAEGESFTAAIEALPVELGVSCLPVRNPKKTPEALNQGKTSNLDICNIQGAPIPSKNSAFLIPLQPLQSWNSTKNRVHRAVKELARHPSRRPAQLEFRGSHHRMEGKVWCERGRSFSLYLTE